jgi:D-alanyl-D-alanine carboxypeptidase (penicillin-binding protein 5/6)
MVRRLTLFVLLVLSAVFPAAAQTAGFQTKAKQAYLVEAETGTILFAQGAEEPVPSASLAKLMTMAVVFEALKKGEITLDTTYPVSEHAWRTGGAPSRTSTMFAALKSEVRVEDLIRGVVVQFANDGCIILAEGMTGSEEAFAARMTEEARALGLTVSTFANATGLPHADNKTTMREMVTLARHIRKSYLQFYRYYAEEDFEWNKIRQRNKNPLIPLNIGADGLATGFAEGYGYSIVASVERDGRRLFLALGGLESDKQRIEETQRMIDWAMTAFERRTIFAAGETIAEASVYGGATSGVPLVTTEKVDVFLPVDDAPRLVARVVYSWPLRAPVEPGVVVGSLRISNEDQLLREVPVETAGSVKVGSLSDQAFDALLELLFFWI